MSDAAKPKSDRTVLPTDVDLIRLVDNYYIIAKIKTETIIKP